MARVVFYGVVSSRYWTAVTSSSASRPYSLPSRLSYLDDQHRDETIPHPTGLAKCPLHPAYLGAFDRAGRECYHPYTLPSTDSEAPRPRATRILSDVTPYFAPISLNPVQSSKMQKGWERSRRSANSMGIELPRLLPHPPYRLSLPIDLSPGAAELTE